MLFDTDEWIVRAAVFEDKERLSNLIERSSFIHRHLGWGSPLDWINSQPFLILEKGTELLAALVCPPDEDGITWLQLFAAAPGTSLYRCWRALWPEALSVLQDFEKINSVNSLVIKPELDSLLAKSGFTVSDRVVVLYWEPSQGRWPDTREEGVVRAMNISDLKEVYKVDKVAFEEIWRNSPSQLEKAYQEAFCATVIELDDKIQGYQITTQNPQGSHLARLAVNPLYQTKGLGTKLVSDLLNRILDQGLVDVTVNTQYQNRASLALYEKFGFRLLDESYPVRQLSIG